MSFAVTVILWEVLWLNIGQLVLMMTSYPIIKENPTPLLFLAHALFLTIGLLLYKPIFDSKKKRIIFSISYICAVGVNATIQLTRYGYFKKAIYETLCPGNIALCGLVSVAILSLTNVVTDSRTLKKCGGNFLEKFLILASFLFVYIITPFTETYFSNKNEFDFTIEDIFPSILIIIFITIVIVVLGTFTLQEEYFRLLLLLFILTLAGYIQEMFLNSKLFLMEGKENSWPIGLKITNLIIWICVVAACILFYLKKKDIAKKTFKYLALIILGMQLAGVMSLFITNQSVESNNIQGDYFSDEGLTQLASKENVIIFVLDTLDLDYANEILEKEPDFFDRLEGFIQYPDTVSQFSRTYPSVEYMLSEKEYLFEIPRKEYNEEALASCKFWDELQDAGYSIYLYDDDSSIVSSSLKQSISNYVTESKEISKKISFSGFAESMFKISNYRLFPYAYKEYESYTAGTVNDSVVKEHVFEKQPFTESEITNYKIIKENGLAVSNEEKAFRFIHLNGAHGPYEMDRNCNEVASERTGIVEQSMGSFEMVFTYLDYLKETGLYKSSIIIITADHGENYVAEELTQNTNPILFIKPQNSQNEELKISDAYASQNDIIPTLAGQIGIETDESWGIDLINNSELTKNRIRHHYFTVVEDSEQVGVKKYLINGSSLDFDNWSYKGDYTEFKYYKE